MTPRPPPDAEPAPLGTGVARHRLDDPAESEEWDLERMRAATPRELRVEPPESPRNRE